MKKISGKKDFTFKMIYLFMFKNGFIYYLNIIIPIKIKPFT